MYLSHNLGISHSLVQIGFEEQHKIKIHQCCRNFCFSFQMLLKNQREYDVLTRDIDIKQICMPNNISYTSIVSILVKEINKTRNQPKSLVPILQQRIKKYDKDNKYYPLKGLNFSVGTREGAKGVQDLIEFLSYTNEVPPLTWSYQLHLAAERRCAAICSNEQNESVMMDRTVQTSQLVSEFTRWQDNLIEMTFYGFIEPIEFISELLLEDAQKTKENRLQFFNKYNKFIGISINTHQKFRYAIVIILASQVLEKKVFKEIDRKHSDSIVEVSEQPVCGNDCSIY